MNRSIGVRAQAASLHGWRIRFAERLQGPEAFPAAPIRPATALPPRPTISEIGDLAVAIVCRQRRHPQLRIGLLDRRADQKAFLRLSWDDCRSRLPAGQQRGAGIQAQSAAFATLWQPIAARRPAPAGRASRRTRARSSWAYAIATPTKRNRDVAGDGSSRGSFFALK